MKWNTMVYIKDGETGLRKTFYPGSFPVFSDDLRKHAAELGGHLPTGPRTWTADAQSSKMNYVAQNHSLPDIHPSSVQF